MKNLFKKKFSLAETAGLIVAALVCVTAVSYGAGLYDTLTQFSPNTTAMSGEVNANFKALADAIDALKAATTPTAATCPDDMVKSGSICVDKYEASIYDAATAGNLVGTASDACNVDGNDCAGKLFARSLAGMTPADYISWAQARAACFNVGKRLLRSSEWLAAAAGTPNTKPQCYVQEGIGAFLTNTGSMPDCKSTVGAYDMVGNASELVDEASPPIIRGGTSNGPADVTTFGQVPNTTHVGKYTSFRCGKDL